MLGDIQGDCFIDCQGNAPTDYGSQMAQKKSFRSWFSIQSTGPRPFPSSGEEFRELMKTMDD
jgi:hypothetical protein